MEIVLISSGIILILAGIFGSVSPLVPGPPLGFAALVLLELSDPDRIFSNWFFAVVGVATLASIALDLILPIMGAKIHGASRAGIWGSVIGMLLGIFYLPPFGMIIGGLLGAIAGEIMKGKKKTEALRAGLAAFFGNVLATTAKLVLSVIMAFYFFSKLI